MVPIFWATLYMVWKFLLCGICFVGQRFLTKFKRRFTTRLSVTVHFVFDSWTRALGVPRYDVIGSRDAISDVTI